MRQYTLAGFATLGTRQSRAVEVAGESATVDATRSFVAAPRAVTVEIPLEVLLDAQAYRVADPSYLVPGARRFGLSRFSCLGTLQSRHGTVEGAEGTLAATREPLVAVARHAEVEVLEGALDAQAYLAAAPSYLVPGMRRFGLSRFSILGTLQSRHGAIEGAEGAIAATRDPLVAAARHGTIEGAEGTLVATRVLVTATRHVAVEGVGGTLAATRVLVTATRHVAVEGVGGTLAATRDPLVAATRHAEIDALGGCLAGRSYAVPDVSGGVSVAFEEVYPI